MNYGNRDKRAISVGLSEGSKLKYQVQELKGIANSMRNTLRGIGSRWEADVIWLQLSDVIKEAEKTLVEM